REAIRAWYHAVLVTLFRAGTLHYHRGRTNWEYVSRVAPEAAWRPLFADVTRVFDREWYGRDASSAESLHDCMLGARQIVRPVRGVEGGAWGSWAAACCGWPPRRISRRRCSGSLARGRAIRRPRRPARSSTPPRTAPRSPTATSAAATPSACWPARWSPTS